MTRYYNNRIWHVITRQKNMKLTLNKYKRVINTKHIIIKLNVQS